jgi:aspartyl-tRNA(Asn)/glutamyl-tRNA(Gln) amidotransferase subunit A
VLGDDVLSLSVRELGDRIRAGKLSPVELAEGYLERSERLGPRLNAYATLTRDRALREARQAEREVRSGNYRGPLHGIPYAAKDLLAVKGYPTTWGAKPFAGQTFPEDAPIIRKLHQAGAVLVGKAAMIELAGGMGYRFASASLTGPARNPWDPDCWAGGSSSGSGVITSAALAAFTLGSETWGSIVCPSAFCGVSGLRPTYGRVSRRGAMALSFSMDKLGVLARTADDCGLVLAVIAGYDPEEPSSLPEAGFAYDPGEGPKPLRVGWLTKAFKKLPADVEAPVKAAIGVLKDQGATVEEAVLPEGPWEPAAGIVISVEGAAAFDSLLDSGRVAELADPLGRIGGYVNQQIPAADYARALRVRRVLQKKIDPLFDRFDVLAAASFPVAAPPLTTNLETGLDFPDPLGGIGNLCGLPAVSVPCGFNTAKLPVGIQFVGRALNEAAVLAAARLFQEHTDWHRRRPPLA